MNGIEEAFKTAFAVVFGGGVGAIVGLMALSVGAGVVALALAVPLKVYEYVMLKRISTDSKRPPE